MSTYRNTALAQHAGDGFSKMTEPFSPYPCLFNWRTQGADYERPWGYGGTIRWFSSGAISATGQANVIFGGEDIFSFP